MDKSARNELLSLLADTKEAAAELEAHKRTNTQPAIEVTSQLLIAYRLEMDLISKLVDLN